MKARPHPEQGYRSCLALIRSTKRYGSERVEAACQRAVEIGSPTRRSVEMILRKGLDQAEVPPMPPPQLTLVHDNVRGGDYFDRKEEE